MDAILPALIINITCESYLELAYYSLSNICSMRYSAIHFHLSHDNNLKIAQHKEKIYWMGCRLHSHLPCSINVPVLFDKLFDRLFWQDSQVALSIDLNLLWKPGLVRYQTESLWFIQHLSSCSVQETLRWLYFPVVAVANCNYRCLANKKSTECTIIIWCMTSFDSRNMLQPYLFLG